MSNDLEETRTPPQDQDGLSRREFLQHATAGGLGVATGAAGSPAAPGAEDRPAQPERSATIPVTFMKL
jgi:hypothetical protein